MSNYRMNMDDFVFQRTSDALHYLDSKIPSELRLPSVGVICGSGLGGLAKTVIPQPRFQVDYIDIPHFPASKGSSQRVDSVFCQPFDTSQFLATMENFCSACWKHPKLRLSSCWEEPSQSKHPFVKDSKI